MSWICRQSIATIGMRAVSLLTPVLIVHFQIAVLENVEESEDIAVARNLPAVEMALGRKVAVVFFDEHNPKEAVVVAVYT